MRRWIVAGSLTVLLGAVLVTFLLAFGKDPHAVPFKLAGQAAPPFKLKRLDTGEEVTLAQLKGHPLILNFWATWCGPCKLEHPVLAWGAREFGREVQFLGVINEDTAENARPYLAENGAAYPQLLDTEGLVGVDYGISGVPETYFIDAQGVIREKYAMPIDPQTLTDKVRALLAPVAVGARN
jgi:cytochrome c biogenesis protein CcmG/thiol:disulfide interchange protein DsbE